MSLSILKTTTSSICMALLLQQPVASFAQTGTSGTLGKDTTCVAGQTPCPAVPPGAKAKGSEKAKAHEKAKGPEKPKGHEAGAKAQGATPAPAPGQRPEPRPPAETKAAPAAKTAPGAKPVEKPAGQNPPAATAPAIPGLAPKADKLLKSPQTAAPADAAKPQQLKPPVIAPQPAKPAAGATGTATGTTSGNKPAVAPNGAIEKPKAGASKLPVPPVPVPPAATPAPGSATATSPASKATPDTTTNPTKPAAPPVAPGTTAAPTAPGSSAAKPAAPATAGAASGSQGKAAPVAPAPGTTTPGTTSSAPAATAPAAAPQGTTAPAAPAAAQPAPANGSATTPAATNKSNPPGLKHLGLPPKGRRSGPVDAAAAAAATAITSAVKPVKVTPQDVRRSNQNIQPPANTAQGATAQPQGTAAQPQGTTGQPQGTTVQTIQPQATAQPGSPPPPAAQPAKKKGLTDFEKFGLLALGAVAVGALLPSGQQVVANTGSRVVIRDPNGSYSVLHDDNVLVRRPGSTVYTRDFADGSVLSRVVLPSGTVVSTVLDANGRVLRRVVRHPGRPPIVLFDDTRPAPTVDVAQLPPPSPVIVNYHPQLSDAQLLRDLERAPDPRYMHRFSLNQVRDIPQVRALVPQADLSTLTFPTNSSAVTPDQAQTLDTLGQVMSKMIARNPKEVFLIEGHTDAVGDPAYNLALSDARAETVALALTEYFHVPPENMVTQGYGEADLKVQTLGPSQANRRVVVRRITDLLAPVTGTTNGQ